MGRDNPIRDGILDVAERAFRKHGPDQISLLGVARELKLPKTILSFYVGDDARLREGIVGRKLDQITAQLSPVFPTNRVAAEKRLSTALDNLVRLSRVFQREDPMLFAVYSSLAHEQALVITQFQRTLISECEAIIKQGMQAREFAEYNPWQASWATLNAIAPFYDPRFGRDWSAPGEHGAYKKMRNSVLHGLVHVADANAPCVDAQRKAARELGFFVDPDHNDFPDDLQ
jgi:AcrR family transcriptional regulator